MTELAVSAVAPLALPGPTGPDDDPAAWSYFSTDWRTGAIREELPLRGVRFNRPLSKHGELRGTYTVGHGEAFIRASATPLVTGILACRDDRPVWDGFLWDDNQTGQRSFEVVAQEWGSFFERAIVSAEFLAAVNAGNPLAWADTDDHAIFRGLLAKAQAYAGYDIGVDVGAGAGPTLSALTVNGWDMASIEDLFTELGNRQGGPNWAFDVAGTLDAPQRRLLLGTPLGRQDIADSGLVLEYVEDTGPAPDRPGGPPRVTTLDNLFPGESPGVRVASLHGSGGNIIAVPTVSRSGSNSATEAYAIGAGEEASMRVARAAASDLIDAGWPRLSKKASYKDVTEQPTLDAHAAGDLQAARGLATVVRLTTFGNDPDWTQVQRGDVCRVELDTDLHGERPYVLTPRILDIAVAPSDDGGHEQVAYTVAAVQEVR